MWGATGGLGELLGPGSHNLPSPFAPVLEEIYQVVARAAAREDCWLARIRTGISAALAYLDEDAECARVFALEAAVAGTAMHECVRRVQSALAPVLTEAREQIIIGAELRPPTGLIAELVTLGVLSVIRAGILRGGGAPLAELESPLMLHIVEPYLGRGAERADRAAQPGSVDLPHGRTEMVPIRPHPRTIQALRAIAAAPRLSSREVGRAIGIDNNSGHISTLLHRLEQRGLIENASSHQAGRQSHTWFLTPYGARVLEVVAHSYAAADVSSARSGAWSAA